MSDETSQVHLIGRYHVLEELGRGGMGIVYKGFDPLIGRTVALKTISLAADDPEARDLRERLYREAGAAGILTHPNIVTIYDVIEHGSTVAVAMEFVEGQTLKSIINDRGPLPVDEALGILHDICEALDFASSRGIVHRDIKPANIHVTPKGRAKVMDFGIARLSATSQMTRSGAVIGSPSYMSPEQVRGLTVDGRSDLFSAAVVFYEMITRERPFGGTDIATTMYRIVHEPPTPAWSVNARIGKPLNNVLERALAKNPADRYESGADLVAELRRAHETQPSIETEPGAAETLAGTEARPTAGQMAVTGEAPVLAGGGGKTPLDEGTNGRLAATRTGPPRAAVAQAALEGAANQQVSAVVAQPAIATGQSSREATEAAPVDAARQAPIRVAMPAPPRALVQQSHRRRSGLILAVAAVVVVVLGLSAAVFFFLGRTSPSGAEATQANPPATQAPAAAAQAPEQPPVAATPQPAQATQTPDVPPQRQVSPAPAATSPATARTTPPRTPAARAKTQGVAAPPTPATSAAQTPVPRVQGDGSQPDVRDERG